MSFIRYTVVVALLTALTEGLTAIDAFASVYITCVLLVGVLAWDIRDHSQRFLTLCNRAAKESLKTHQALMLVAFFSILAVLWMMIYWAIFIAFGIASMKMGGFVTAMFIIFMAWSFNPDHINRLIFIEQDHEKNELFG